MTPAEPISPAPAAPPPPTGARPGLARAFAGVCRLTLPRSFAPGHALVVLVLLVLLGVIATAMLNARDAADTYLKWTVEFYFTFLVPVLAFLSGAGAIRDDMKPATVDYVLTRPVPRAAFVAFKYVAHVIGAQVEFVLGAAVLAGLGIASHIPGMAAAMPSLLLGQFMLVLAFSGLGFACGALTSRYVIVGLAYGAIIEAGAGQIPTQLSRLSMTHQVRAVVLPVADSLPASGTPAMLLILLAYSIVMVAVAAGVFHLRELVSAPEA